MGLAKLNEKVYTWFRYSATLRYDLNGHYLDSEEGNVLVDPPELTFDEIDEIDTLGPPDLILITNRTHWRDTDAHLERWAAPVVAHEVEAPRLPRSDRTLTDGDRLPGGWQVIFVPGKTVGEMALYCPEGEGVLLVGDTIIGDPPGQLRILPDEKVEDKAKLMESLRRLADLRFETLLVGDGHSVFGGADRLVRDLVSSLPDGSRSPARQGRADGARVGGTGDGGARRGGGGRA